jgi:hypothetical protein
MRTMEWRHGRWCALVVARSDVQHPQRLPLGGLPAVWCSGARSRPCQLIPARVGRFAGLLAGLDGAVNKRNLSTGETGELVRENVG